MFRTEDDAVHFYRTLVHITLKEFIIHKLSLEIPENGILFRVPMSTVEYQIGHDQKLIFLPPEPQKL